MLARAGLARIGRLDEATEVLDPLQMLPAPGQGALAVECRADDDLVGRARACSTTPHARAAVTAERAVLATLEGGCAAPIGALAEVVEGDDGDELWVQGGRAVPRRGAGGPDVRHRRPGRRRRRRHPPRERDARRRGGQLMEAPHEQPVTDCERQDA